MSTEKRSTYTWNDDVLEIAKRVGKDIRESERIGHSIAEE